MDFVDRSLTIDQPETIGFLSHETLEGRIDIAVLAIGPSADGIGVIAVTGVQAFGNLTAFGRQD